MRARYYNPAWGRFISEDPIGFGGGVNLYEYAANSPIGFIDPTGLCTGSGCANVNQISRLLTIGLTAACAAAEPCGAGEALALGSVAAGAIILDALAPQNQSPQSVTGPVHGNSLDSQRQTYLYQLTDVTSGAVLKYGITSEPNPINRYSTAFYAATNSQMQVLSTYQNRIGARIGELSANIGYYFANGQLPPLTTVP